MRASRNSRAWNLARHVRLTSNSADTETDPHGSGGEIASDDALGQSEAAVFNMCAHGLFSALKSVDADAL